MKIKELIEILSKANPEAEVHISVDFVTGDVEAVQIKDDRVWITDEL